MTFNALLQLRQRLRRRRRRIAIGLIAALLVLGGVWVVLIEGTILGVIVAWAIGWKLNATCTIDHFEWNGWNRAVIRGLSLRVPEWPDSASEVASVDEMSADFDPVPLLWGSLALTDITIDRMTVRVIGREDDSEINLLELRLPATGGTMASPTLNVSHLSFVLGTLRRGTDIVDIDTERELVGGISSDRTMRGKWRVNLTGRPSEGTTPLSLSGSLVGEPFSYSLTLRHLSLDESLQQLFPGPVREVARTMELSGLVDEIEIEGDREHPVRSARIQVSDLDLMLPDPGLEDAWVVYRDEKILPAAGLPRIQVQHGVVRFDDWRLTLEQLRGQLISSADPENAVPMPVELSFSIDLARGRLRDWDGFDAESWAEAALEHAPFDMHLTIPGFTFKAIDGHSPTLELPRAAAEIFSNFMVREGTVSIEAHVSRAPPLWAYGEAPGPDMPDEGPVASVIEFDGSVAIQDGLGGYFKFPYQLADVQAHITFSDDIVNVHYLHGRGAEDSKVSVTGTVYDPGDDAGVDLIIASDRVPIDERLESALRYSPAQRFLTLLFNRRAFQSLEESGLIERTVAAMEARQSALLEESMKLDADGARSASNEPRLAEIAAELKRLFALSWLRNFTPGGWCAMNLRVQREVGGGDVVTTTGAITLLEANALCEPLPYPMFVAGRDRSGQEGATIIVEDERIRLPADGLRIQFPGGGTGAVKGSIDMPRNAEGQRDVTPHIVVETTDDAINPLLLAAIPLDNPDGPIRGAREGWPGRRRSEVAETISAIGLSGILASKIDVGGDGTGGIAWSADIELTEGIADPQESVESDVAESGLEWPAAFRLERCTASVDIDENHATLKSFEGWHLTGRVHGEGEIDLVHGDRELKVRFEEMPAGLYLINFLPHQRREEGRRFWALHAPEGTFNAELDWSSTRDGDRRRKLRVVPIAVSFLTHVPGNGAPVTAERVTVEREAGDLVIVDRATQARALRLSIRERSLPASTLVIDGGYGASKSGRPLELGASWTGARFESPLLVEALHLAGAQDTVDLWREIHPQGAFDAIMTYRVSGAEALWRVRVEPDTLTGTFDGVTTTVRVDPAAPPVIIDPEGVQLTDFRGTTDNGRFDVDGVVPLTGADAPGRRLRIDYDGSRVGPPELALMGRGARRALAAIEFVADGPVRLDDGEVLYRDDDGAVGTSFRGVISLERASFRAGVEFEELDAIVRVAVDPQFTSRLDIDASRFRVMDRPVRDTAAVVLIDPDGSRIDIPSIDGKLAGGSASAGARVTLGDHVEGGGFYEVWTKLVGAQLDELPAAPVDVAIEAAIEGTRRSTVANRATGRVDGEVVLGGPINDPQRRAGRGRIEIREGRMADLPITMSLLQVSHLMLPLNTALDSGDVRFHISGNRAIFERFELRSPTMEFRGGGELDLKTDQISLRLQNRGTVPIWSDVFGAVYDTLFAIDVTGPIQSPIVSVAPLPSLFGRAPMAANRGAP